MKFFIIFIFPLVFLGCSVFPHNERHKIQNLQQCSCNKEIDEAAQKKPIYTPQSQVEQRSNQLQWDLQNQNNRQMNDMLKSVAPR